MEAFIKVGGIFYRFTSFQTSLKEYVIVLSLYNSKDLNITEEAYDYTLLIISNQYL
jgi:hypothetical protein